jgi:hypothetical protein
LIWLKLETPPNSLWHLHLICFLHSPKNSSLSHKQREEEDFPHSTFFYFFNLQTFQALKAKNNPNQTIKNANQVTEEEDLPFRTPFFLQSANNTNLKQQKQPKASFSKCICNPSSSITQQKNPHIFLYKHPTLRTNSPTSYAQNSSTQLFLTLHKYPKIKHIDSGPKKSACAKAKYPPRTTFFCA